MSDPISALAMAGLAPLAGFITNAVNDHISGKRQKELLEMQMDYNSLEAQKARDFTENMMFEQMAYQTKERQIANSLENSALSRQSADMQRIGINPLLSASFSGFGNASPMSAPSGASSGIASSPSALPLTSFRNDNLSNVLMSIPDLYLKYKADKRDEGRLENETNETNANVDLVKAKTASEKIETLYKEKNLELKDIEKDVLKANLDVLASQGKKNLKDIENIDAQIAKTWGEVDLNEALRKLKVSEQEYILKQISHLSLKNKSIEQMDKIQLEKLEQEIVNLKTDDRVTNSAEVRGWLDLLVSLIK